MTGEPATIIASFAIGIALASAPGAVMAVLLGEAIHGGLVRGLQAALGSTLASALQFAALALGLVLVAPTGIVLQALKVAGGVYLFWLAVDAFRSAAAPIDLAHAPRRAPAVVLGGLAVLLSPGSWLFLAAVASPLFAQASKEGGIGAVLVAAIALLLGITLGDAVVVAVGGLGVRRAHAGLRTWIRRGLAGLLFVLALLLLVSGLLA